MNTAEVVQANIATIFATNGVRNFGDEIGWHTARNRSADIISRNMEEVNCVMDVLT